MTRGVYDLLLSSADTVDIEACRRAFRQGAVDYLSKPIDEQDLIDAVQKAESSLQSTAAVEAESKAIKALIARLTTREREVIELVSRGLTSREIGDMPNLSARTVDTNRANAGPKLGNTSVAEITQVVTSAQNAT